MTSLRVSRFYYYPLIRLPLINVAVTRVTEQQERPRSRLETRLLFPPRRDRR